MVLSDQRWYFVAAFVAVIAIAFRIVFAPGQGDSITEQKNFAGSSELGGAMLGAGYTLSEKVYGDYGKTTIATRNDCEWQVISAPASIEAPSLFQTFAKENQELRYYFDGELYDHQPSLRELVMNQIAGFQIAVGMKRALVPSVAVLYGKSCNIEEIVGTLNKAALLYSNAGK